MPDLWPTFFLIGAPKAGTTTVFEQVARHPDVFCPIVKEPNFFNTDIVVPDAPTIAEIRRRHTRDRAHFACIRDESTYIDLYRDAGGCLARGDGSVNYLHSAVAARNIRARVPNARLIAILRNPIERAYSHYVMDQMIGRTEASFTAQVERQLRSIGRQDYPGENYIEIGLYMPQLQRFLDEFGREPLLILLFDDLETSPAATMEAIFRHIGVPPRPIAPLAARENVGKVSRFERLNSLLYRTGLKRLLSRAFSEDLRKKAKKLYYRHQSNGGISDFDRQRLRDVFHDDVAAVGALVGRDLSSWLA